MADSTVISVKGLTRKFGTLTAVDRISFEVFRGEIFGFLGPNGAGKTTTMRMLTGIIEPTSGSAFINGYDICRDSILAREHIAVVPEQANVYLDFTVWRNMMLMAELYGIPRERRVAKGEMLLEIMGLEDKRDTKAARLSKGLKQRLMLCAALVTEPEVLFLDEPTGGLDVHSARLIRNVLRDLNAEGLTVFLTTHNMAEAGEICSRVAIIKSGRLVAVDTPVNLKSTMRRNRYVEAVFNGNVPTGDELGSIPGMIRFEVDGMKLRLFSEHPGKAAAALASMAAVSGYELMGINTCEPTFEDVFLFYTSEKGRRK